MLSQKTLASGPAFIFRPRAVPVVSCPAAAAELCRPVLGRLVARHIKAGWLERLSRCFFVCVLSTRRHPRHHVPVLILHPRDIPGTSYFY